MDDTRRDFVRRVAERASFLHERLAGGALEPETSSNDAVEPRWARWAAQMGVAGEDGVRRRIAWSGWTEDRARRALAGARLVDDGALPLWAMWLERLLRDLERPMLAGDDVTRTAAAPIAFEDALAPLVRSAHEQLHERAQRALTIATPEAIRGLERELLTTLSALAGDVLFVDLQARRAVADAVGTRREGGHYAALVANLAGGGWRHVFDEYPVLARFIATAVWEWVDSTAELLARLQTDIGAIAEMIRRDSLGDVVSIRTGLSDRHDGGRTTAFVRFASNDEVVYKPRGLAADAAFAKLTAWLNARGASPPLQSYRSLDRGIYGWSERVPRRACAMEEEANRYFERAGMLLALLHALVATDAHADNIVACGEHPVLVDLETLQTPLVREHDATPAEPDRSVVAAYLDESVLSTYLLPCWATGLDNDIHDIGGLEGSPSAPTTRMVPGWSRINSDEMQRARVAAPPPWRPNSVTVDGSPRVASARLAFVLRGFRHMYDLLVRRRDALLEPGGPLDELASLPVRTLFRPTSVYATLIDGLGAASVLRDGADASLSMDALAHGLVEQSRRPHVWPMVDDELRALARLDVPRFVTRADCTGLPLSCGVTLPGFLSTAGHARVRARVEGLGADDLAVQSGLITRTLGAFGSPESPSVAATARVQGDSATFSRDDWLARACDIAERIRESAIAATDGSVTWLTLAMVDHRQYLRLEPMRHRLYDGQAGMAFFLAALEDTIGGGYRDLALSALAPLRSRIRAGISPTQVAVEGLGACTGLGSEIYALTRCAEWLREPALLDDARRASSLVTASLVAREEQPDVMSGLAGMILSLLALDRAAPDRETMRLATSCGERLLALREMVGPEAAKWPLSRRVPALTGMAHGAAGIALALTRLSNTTGRDDVLRAAEQAIAFERRHFMSDVANWADLRVRTEPGERPATFLGWCAGAPGIALARLGGLAAMDTPAIRAEIDVALETTREVRLKSEHHLCCGTMGLVDALLEGAARLNRPELRIDAAHTAEEVIASMGAESDMDAGRRGCTPSGGLFRGIAGLGFECIRCAEPGRIPSVLLFD